MNQSLQELAARLKDAVDRLEEGRLMVSEVAPMTDAARELYERLVALRYAAIEREVKGESEADPDDGGEAPAFRFTEVLPGQTSLIDAIEEIQREQVDEDEPAVELPLASDEVEEPQTERVEPQPEPVPEPFAHRNNPQRKPSVNDNNVPKAGVAKSTVAERLRRTPIEDLRKAIGLNQKFQFINDLFGGDSTRYNLLIDEVNSASSKDIARELLGRDNPRLREPEEDDKVANSLVQLVERRFL